MIAKIKLWKKRQEIKIIKYCYLITNSGAVEAQNGAMEGRDTHNGGVKAQN
jgi:hypothetical protein